MKTIEKFWNVLQALAKLPASAFKAKHVRRVLALMTAHHRSLMS